MWRVSARCWPAASSAPTVSATRATPRRSCARFRSCASSLWTAATRNRLSGCWLMERTSNTPSVAPTVFVRESKGAWSPHSYAVLARAQLALGEPAADIGRTLDEYAALLESTEFHLFEGELHELRARLAEREGRHAERAAALQRAYDCYTRFGMTAQATRVAEAIR